MQGDRWLIVVDSAQASASLTVLSTMSLVVWLYQRSSSTVNRMYFTLNRCRLSALRNELRGDCSVRQTTS